jgi:lipopolysaccharide export system permease protein
MANYQLRQIFTVVALWMPAHAYELLPIAVLIGTLYVLAHLSSNSEYTVMRAAGLSPLRAGWCSPRSGSRSSVCTFVLGEWIAPYQRAGGAAGAHAGDAVADRRQPELGTVVQGRALVHQRARGARGTALGGVRIYEFDAAYRCAR